MARKKQKAAEEGAYWMDTYGDMVTLLLTFFVLLFAMSSLDEAKWEFFVKAFQGKVENATQIVIQGLEEAEEAGSEMVPPEGDGETLGEVEKIEDITNFEDLFMFLKQYVEEKGLESEVALSKGEGYTFIQFRNNIFFDGNSAVLRTDGIEILEVMSQMFARIPEQIKEVAVYGHTAQEQADKLNDLYIDWSLSGDRAKNVTMYLIRNSGLGGAKFSNTGYGQYRPIVPHDGTEETRKKNRRVEFRISQEGAAITPLEDIYDAIDRGETPDLTPPPEEEIPPVEEEAPVEPEAPKHDADTIFLNLPNYNIAQAAKKVLDGQ